MASRIGLNGANMKSKQKKIPSTPPFSPLLPSLGDITAPSIRTSESGKQAAASVQRTKAKMVKKKGLETLESPVSAYAEANSSPNDFNSQVAHVQTTTNGDDYDLRGGSYNEDGQDMNARIPYDQPTSAMDGIPHEQEDFTPLRDTPRVRRQSPVDDEPSSRARMWDPVKDCSDPNTIQADLPGFLPGGHSSSEQVMDSTIRNITSMDIPFCHGDHPYGQGQDNGQHFENSGTTGSASMGLLPYPQPHAMTSGFQESALMGLLPYPQPQAMASGYQGNASMASHSYDQFQGSRQHQSGYENISISPPRLRASSGQNGQQSLESITRGTALMGIQPHQAGYLHGSYQENRQQFMGMRSTLPAPMASHESASPRRSSPLTSPNVSTNSPTSKHVVPAELDSEQANHLQRQGSSGKMSRALGMARYAESLDQQSNYKEAVRAYDQACTLFQEVIIRSSSFLERMECNNARNTYQARLNVLLQESAASQMNSPSEEDNQQEDDCLGRGKPQYSLYEDWELCRKVDEDLSWQEVAETPTFKGKRKHRSLSQRKHTIGKMGPKFHEAEEPWTVEEDRKLCAMGDAGKTLGDIHRKFRSRNAERCLKRYFRLRGYRATDRSHIRTSHQARQAPAPYPLSTQHTHSSSLGARHRGYILHSSTSVNDPVSYDQSIGTVLQQNYQIPPNSSQNIRSGSTLRHQIPGVPASSPAFTGPEIVTNSTAAMSVNDAASTLTSRTHLSDSTRYAMLHEPPRQQRLASASSSSSQPGACPRKFTPPMSPDNPSSPQAVGNESTDRLPTSRSQRLAPSSSPPASAANTSTNTTPPTSSRNSPATPSPPPKTHDSPDSQSAAADGVRKSRRPAHLGTA